MASYKEDFPVGSRVRIADTRHLGEFQRTWQYHNKLTCEQLAYAGQVAGVEAVGFYHGGDVLYELRGVPGVWHEQCLAPATAPSEPRMTPKEVEEHNRAYEEASQLVMGEIILDGGRPDFNPTKSVRSKLEQALQLFGRVLQLNPNNWAAMWQAGKIHQRLNDQSAALSCFARAHEVNPSQPDVAREASICAMHMGQGEDAIWYARNALQCRPSDNGLQANLALAFLLAGKTAEAKATIDQAAEGGAMDTVSRTVRNIINHFVATGERPPTTTGALEDYWRGKIGNEGR